MASSVKDISFPLGASQKVAMMRNVEKLLGEALGSTDEVFSDVISFLVSSHNVRS